MVNTETFATSELPASLPWRHQHLSRKKKLLVSGFLRMRAGRLWSRAAGATDKPVFLQYTTTQSAPAPAVGVHACHSLSGPASRAAVTAAD